MKFQIVIVVYLCCSYPAILAQNIDYLNQTPPGNIPEIFAQGIISVENSNSHALVFSPDGKTLIFSRYPDRKSYMMVYDKGKWSDPTEASFFGKEVSFTPDGNKIYYYTGGDIFYVKRETSGWSNPEKVSGAIISNDQVEYYPCIVNSGAMYFSRNSNWKDARIMYAEIKNGQFIEAVDLGSPVNDGGASHAWVAPDESYMLFNSPREGSYTQNDIWVSFRNSDKSWGVPKNLGEKVNAAADAVLCPTVSRDGKYLFFTRLKFGDNNTGLIYWVSTNIFIQLNHD
ncbi:MAG: PD40 domain-containing protein [Bacteroidales bacterium]|nr:PD40 domain-containing protein [Bacteroidales bacterium]